MTDFSVSVAVCFLPDVLFLFLFLLPLPQGAFGARDR